MSKDLIVKHNELIEARYSMTPNEAKVVALLASVIKKEDEDFKVYTFQAPVLLEMLGLGEKHHGELRETVKRLMRRVVSIGTPRSILDVHFLSSAEYFPGGRVELEFSPKIKPYLLQLKQNFTSYRLENVLRLQSTYAIRIYELCKQYEKIGEREIEIVELRELLDLGERRLRKYSHFKQKVLVAAQKAINEDTDLNIRFEELKTARSVTAIRFLIKKNPAAAVQTKAPPVPKRSSATSDLELRKIKQAEDDARWEKAMVRLREEFKKLPESEQNIYLGQQSFLDFANDEMRFDWAVSNWARTENKWEADVVTN